VDYSSISVSDFAFTENALPRVVMFITQERREIGHNYDLNLFS